MCICCPGVVELVRSNLAPDFPLFHVHKSTFHLKRTQEDGHYRENLSNLELLRVRVVNCRALLGVSSHSNLHQSEVTLQSPPAPNVLPDPAPESVEAAVHCDQPELAARHHHVGDGGPGVVLGAVHLTVEISFSLIC